MASTAAVRSEEPPAGAPDPKFAELRTLLVGPEQRQLRALQTRLDDPVAQARDVSRVLPTAVELRASDPHLKRALAPTIEESIAASVRRNPQPLADALFPIIGPAIRKAIASTLNGMLESLNTTLEHSLSWRSLRWRLDARRTGRSFAEIVLLNTLVYRVEQVFLIHRPSGLLLQHVTAGGADTRDADMVSGMLTAIRDFVQDSFHVPADEGLQTLRVGELSVWIEQGPHALVAAVIRGTAPPELRITLQQAVEGVHARWPEELGAFDGDASRYKGAVPLLEACLQQQFRARQGRSSRRRLLVGAALVLLALGVWAFFALRARARWEGYLAALRAEPGIVIVSTGRERGQYVVNGLRDPLARDPGSLVAVHALDAADVTGRWQLYQALDPPLVLARADRLLAPPSGVRLALRDGVLSASGPAPVEWIETSARLAPALPGVARFDPSATVDEAVRALSAEIEAASPLFVKGTATFAAGGEEVIRGQLQRLRALEALALAGNLRFVVELVGEADTDGAPQANLPLSRERAARVQSALAAAPLQRVALTATGIGSRGDADPTAGEDVKQRNRRVAFRILREGERR